MCVREMFASSNEGETERIGVRDRDSLTFLVGFSQTKTSLVSRLAYSLR
jgi:hypothetical protein